MPANAADIRDRSSIPGPGRSSGRGHSNPLCILAWRIPRTEQPGRLYSPWGQTAQSTKSQTGLSN